MDLSGSEQGSCPAPVNMIISYTRIYIQQDATLHSLFITGNCSTCFGWYLHPSSGAHTTVSTASGICHTVTDYCRCRGSVGTAVPPPIIRSAYNCIYTIWYWSHRYCFLPLSWKCWDCGTSTQSAVPTLPR